MNRHRGHGAERDETGATGGCAEFGPLLEAYYHHALDPQQAQSVAEHAAGCAACSTTLERFAATDQLIAAAPTSAPGPELRQQLAIRIAAERAARSIGAAAPVSIERTTVVHDMNDMNDSPWTRSETQTTQTGRPWQRMRVWLGTAAAMLVVALLAGTLLTRMHGAPGQTSTGVSNFTTHTATCDPQKVKVQLPANGYFGDFDMVSPDEGWAVGSIMQLADPSLAAQSALIVHYQHCAWTAIKTNFPNAGLSSVSMGSATDGWAIGTTNENKPLVLHFSNGVWSQVTLPGESALDGVYSSAHMLSANEGWIIVNHTKNSQGLMTFGLLHLFNGRWSEAEAPFPVVEDVLPVAPNEAWVVGSASTLQESPVLYHFQAGTWTRTQIPVGVQIDTLRMVSPNNIWVSGHINGQSNDLLSQTEVALHYDGSQWREASVSAPEHPQILETFDQGTSLAFTLAEKPDNMPGTRFYISSALYQQGGDWERLAWPFSDLNSVGNVTRVAADEYWAVGSYPVLEITPQANGSSSGYGYSVPVLLYFANGAWHRYTQ